MEVEDVPASSVGSRGIPFRLFVVGGGPAAVSIVVRAVRLNVHKELLEGNSGNSDSGRPKIGGICIIEKNESKRSFGGGKLCDYIINSNTWANKFVTNVIKDKPDVIPPESIQGTILENLNGSKMGAYLVDTVGAKPGALNKVGDYLCEVGTQVHDLIQEHPTTSSCLFGCKCVAVERVDALFTPLPVHLLPTADSNTGVGVASGAAASGVAAQGTLDDIIASSLPIATPAPAGTDSDTDAKEVCCGWRITVEDVATGKLRAYYASHAVLATGGHQPLPSSALSTSFSSLPSYITKKFMTTDDACTEAGVKIIEARLLRAVNNNCPRRVVIVGGSHSAFSVAWVCLNKVVLHPPTKGPLATKEKSNVSGKDKEGGAEGDVQGPPPQVWQSNSISLLHRSAIQVFFSTRKEATEEQYTDIGVVNKTTGQIHPFGGLRGDAKELWRSVRRSKEPRVRLQQLRSDTGDPYGWMSQTLVQKLFEEAVVIIWGCGYSTNMVPVRELSGKTVPMSYWCGTQVEVDDSANILRKCDERERAAHAIKLQTELARTKQAHRSPVRPVAVAAATATDTPAPAAVVAPAAAVAVSQNPPTSDSVHSCEATKDGGSTPSPVPLALSVSVESSTVTEDAEPLTVVVPEPKELSGPISPGSASSTSPAATPVRAPTLIAGPPVAYAFQGVPVGNLYGCGLGFGLKALFENGEPDGSSGRADGVAVYLKRAATLILANVLGAAPIFGEGNFTWEERNAKISKLVAAATAAAAAASGNTSTPASPGTPSSGSRRTPSATPTTPTRSSSSANSTGTPTRHVPKHSTAGVPSPVLPSGKPKDKPKDKDRGKDKDKEGLKVPSGGSRGGSTGTSSGGIASGSGKGNASQAISRRKSATAGDFLDNLKNSVGRAGSGGIVSTTYSSNSAGSKRPDKSDGGVVVPVAEAVPVAVLTEEQVRDSVERLSRVAEPLVPDVEAGGSAVLLDAQTLADSVARLSQPSERYLNVGSGGKGDQAEGVPSVQLDLKTLTDSVSRLSQVPKRYQQQAPPAGTAVQVAAPASKSSAGECAAVTPAQACNYAEIRSLTLEGVPPQLQLQLKAEGGSEQAGGSPIPLQRENIYSLHKKKQMKLSLSQSLNPQGYQAVKLDCAQTAGLSTGVGVLIDFPSGVGAGVGQGMGNSVLTSATIATGSRSAKGAYVVPKVQTIGAFDLDIAPSPVASASAHKGRLGVSVGMHRDKDRMSRDHCDSAVSLLSTQSSMSSLALRQAPSAASSRITLSMEGIKPSPPASNSPTQRGGGRASGGISTSPIRVL